MFIVEVRLDDGNWYEISRYRCIRRAKSSGRSWVASEDYSAYRILWRRRIVYNSMSF